MKRYHDLNISIFYQSSNQQKQASYAITLYHSLIRSDSKNSFPDSKELNNSVNENIPDYNKDLSNKDKHLNKQCKLSQSVQSNNSKKRQADFTNLKKNVTLEKKYKNCAKELIWQWYFPAKQLTTVPDTKELKRHHIHETRIQVVNSSECHCNLIVSFIYQE